MVKATHSDKPLVVDILAKSFDDNKSVNYIVKQDSKRDKRLRKLMEYSFDICHLFGEVLLSDDKKGCALIVMSDKKKTTLKSTLLDAKLAMSVIGLSNVKKAANRESRINQLHPKEPFYYLWFIGVDPDHQSKGIGSKLLNEIIKDSTNNKKAICLETSTIKNIPWYKKFGFETYNELDLSYKLYFLKRN